MALTLPIDVVPLLDDVLLVIAVPAFQRVVGRRVLRDAGFRLRGTRITPLG